MPSASEEVERARERIDKLIAEISTTAWGDAVHGSFDIVLTADVLEYICTPEQLLTDARRNFAPDRT